MSYQHKVGWIMKILGSIIFALFLGVAAAGDSVGVLASDSAATATSTLGVADSSHD